LDIDEATRKFLFVEALIAVHSPIDAIAKMVMRIAKVMG
jgi:hypothetical protein